MRQTRDEEMMQAINQIPRHLLSALLQSLDREIYSVGNFCEKLAKFRNHISENQPVQGDLSSLLQEWEEKRKDRLINELSRNLNSLLVQFAPEFSFSIGEIREFLVGEPVT